MKRLLLPLLAVMAIGPAQIVVVPAATAQAKRDWTQSVAMTPEGGFRMGNPAAAVKLVEYGSLTCPHCAHFAEAAMPNLLTEVRSGRVSYELRNFVRDPADLAAALLSRCAGVAGYFPFTEKVFSTQEQWIDRLRGMTEAQQKALETMTPAQRVSLFASTSGLTAMAAQAGVPAAKANSCLADQKATDQLLEIRRVAVEKDGLEGTPTFLINGKKVDGITDWASLQPHLATAK